jgi:hypothetical protein
MYTRENISLYIPNNRTLPLIQTINRVCRLLGSSTVKLQVKGPRGMIWLELQKVLHIPSTPVNLFSGLQFESLGGYLKRGVIYNSQDQAVAQVDTTSNRHFLRVIN